MSFVPSYVIPALDSGFHWHSDVISYSVPVSGSKWTYAAEATHPEYATLNTQQTTQFQRALALWGNLIAVEIAELKEPVGTGDIRIAFTANDIGGSYAGYSRYPSSYDSSGDVWIHSRSQDEDFAMGSYYFGTLLHELGHALGLSHVHAGEDYPEDENNYIHTIMSSSVDREVRSLDMNFNINDDGYLTYSLDYVRAHTPMIYDIAAIQSMYGVNSDFNSDDTVYRWQQNEVFYETLWDGGGVDTLDFSNQLRPNNINLSSGVFSDVAIRSTEELIAESLNEFSQYPDYFIPQKVKQYQQDIYTGEQALNIAYGADIENVIGGQGDDRLIGNTLDNQLEGRGGNDYLNGAEGVDTVVFSCLFEQASILNDGGSWLVSGKEGVDRLVNVEKIVFDDVVLYTSRLAVQDYRLSLIEYEDNITAVQGVELVGHSVSNKQGYQAILNIEDDREFLNQLYSSVLLRQADNSGFRYWQSQLAEGMQRSDVLLYFVDSDENIQLQGHHELQDGLWLV